MWSGDGRPFSGPLAISQFPNQVIQDPTRLQILTDTPPPGLAQYFRLTLYDADIPGGANPRIQFAPFPIGRNGQTQIVSGWTRYSYVPTVTSGKFFETHEMFGNPNLGSPPISQKVDNSGNLEISSEQPQTSPFFFNLWTKPLAPMLNTWLHWSYTVKYSVNPALGTLAFGFASDGTDNDVAQTLALGGQSGTQITMQTLDSDSGGQQRATAAALYMQIYRARTLEAVSTVDHAGFMVRTVN